MYNPVKELMDHVIIVHFVVVLLIPVGLIFDSTISLSGSQLLQGALISCMVVGAGFH